jgi:signal peptidase I
VTSEGPDSTSASDPAAPGVQQAPFGATATEPDKRKKKHLPIWQETILLLAIAMALAIVIKALFVQAFYIPSESMEPGLIKNDRILVQKVSYWFGGTPERGDVVVFQDPGGWLGADESAGPTNDMAKLLAKIGLYPTGGHLVKRVIGVAGDTIVCCDEQGRISVNGQPLNEKDYARLEPQNKCYGPMVGNCDWEVGPVPDNHIFVMGDNRGNSRDSTAHMCLQTEKDCTKNPYIDVDDVVGKVFLRLWPSDRLKVLHRPPTFDDVPDAP